MPAAPLPPFLPESLEAFTEHVATHIPEWFKYCREAYEYIDHTGNALANTQEKPLQADLRTQALEKEIEHLKHRHEIERAQYEATHNYQDEQLEKMTQKLINLAKERNQAISLAAPAVNTPLSTPVPESQAERLTAPTTRTPTPTPTPASESSRVSERLPDPEKFEGDRKDLRRFTSQVQEKLTVNRDRFPTPQSRMAYVTSRLRGDPYAQVLPYIRNGVCQLKDYDEILDLLDRAFGDPNRVNNARKSLFRLRQSNKDFSTFFAEFQRLALEGDMPEESLSTLLEEAISRELKGMLLHHEPPSRDYRPLAKFLQGLENRLHQYESAPPAPKTYATVTKPRPALAALSPVAPTPIVPAVIPGPAPTRPPAPDAMDLRRLRRRPSKTTTRRDRGECFRCGSSTHLVRDCPMPDNRVMRAMGPVRGRSTSPDSEGSSGKSASPDPSLSVNGVSLG